MLPCLQICLHGARRFNLVGCSSSMHAPSKGTTSPAGNSAGLLVVASGLWPEFRRLPGNCQGHNLDATGFFSNFPTFLTLFRRNPAFLSTKLTFLREEKSFYLELKPFYFELKPFYLELKPFYFELKPFLLELKPFYLELKPFYLELKSFYCELKSFYCELKPFYLELKSFLLGQISFFLGQFRQKTAFFSGLPPEFRVICPLCL